MNQFCSILEKGGYSVEPAGPGGDALEGIGRRRFQLVIIDVKIPDVSRDARAGYPRDPIEPEELTRVVGEALSFRVS